jgi:hypothetical protein
VEVPGDGHRPAAERQHGLVPLEARAVEEEAEGQRGLAGALVADDQEPAPADPHDAAVELGPPAAEERLPRSPVAPPVHDVEDVVGGGDDIDKVVLLPDLVGVLATHLVALVPSHRDRLGRSGDEVAELVRDPRIIDVDVDRVGEELEAQTSRDRRSPSCSSCARAWSTSSRGASSRPNASASTSPMASRSWAPSQRVKTTDAVAFR